MSIPDEVTTLTPQDQQGSSLYAALARTTTRAITLYFSRPVRLFRPSKGNGWHSLRGHANKHGATLNPQYISSLVKSQGFIVIPKHFVPPMLANAVLGTVLWTTYTGSSTYLEPYLGHHSTFTVALSGAAAGGMQAFIAAPVENVRLAMEGGTGRGWSHTWKEVFCGTQPIHSATRVDQIRDIRQIRLWMKDVSEMAGRGWTGWGWGFGKDIFAFAAFFMVFEMTRKAAVRVKGATQYAIQELQSGGQPHRDLHLPRVTHALTLVGGGALAGLTYETLCRPWDVARRVIELENTLPSHSAKSHSPVSTLVRKAREDGIASFFREQPAALRKSLESQSSIQRRIFSARRTLVRVGPWGMGFLVWEALGPGLD
ncbi:hypothetical protein PAXRUDRAFT_136834 [Paxillus rubicundulus Ve08.2h10]|uniref:Mitochondrial carrier n=1 Tax=Paxillus rubicundulus Ve08.2h10 TaxID=930991 RepID=A0A0D0DGP5_9AGAM|nr:hypothetical protein PAXRUDRAFT_136834 [Paxillus rubicundulus Ve08.2h10]